MDIKNLNPIKSILFSLITCGIYQIYWTFCIVKEYLMFTNKRGDITFEILISILLPFIGLYLVERKFSEGCAAQGIEHTDRAVVYLILSVFPFGALLSLAFMQAELNKINEILQA